MKAIFLLFLFVGSIYGQQISNEEFLRLSLEEKVDIFFKTYQDDRNQQIGASRFAEYIVLYHGYAVVPLIKERLVTADYFQTVAEPKDITLTLIAYILSRLHIYSDRALISGIPTYHLADEEIQWFFDEYMRRIDTYILSTHLIDETVMNSNFDIISVLYRRYNASDFAKFGYPFFYDKQIKYCGNDLRRYYEERLGIQNLRVVLPFLE